MAEIDLKYYLLRGKVCTLALPTGVCMNERYRFHLVLTKKHRARLVIVASFWAQDEDAGKGT